MALVPPVSRLALCPWGPVFLSIDGSVLQPCPSVCTQSLGLFHGGEASHTSLLSEGCEVKPWVRKAWGEWVVLAETGVGHQEQSHALPPFFIQRSWEQEQRPHLPLLTCLPDQGLLSLEHSHPMAETTLGHLKQALLEA